MPIIIRGFEFDLQQDTEYFYYETKKTGPDMPDFRRWRIICRDNFVELIKNKKYVLKEICETLGISTRTEDGNAKSKVNIVNELKLLLPFAR